MASSGAIRAGKAFIELFADSGKLGPTLKAAGDQVKNWAASVNSGAGRLVGLTEKLDPLAEKSGKIADAVDSLGNSFGGAGQKVSPMTRGFATVAGSAAKLVTTFKNCEVAMAALSAAGIALGALTSPFGLIAAAAVGIGVAFVKFTDTGKTAFAKSSEFVKGFKNDALETFGAITNAIEVGDLNAAWEVVTTTLDVAWQKMKKGILEAWKEAEHQIVDLMYGIAEVGNFVWGEIQKAWIDMGVEMLKAWKKFYDTFIADSKFMKGVMESVAGAFLGPFGGQVSAILENAGKKGPDLKFAENKKKEIDKSTRERGNEIREQNKTARQGINAEFDPRIQEAENALEEARKRRRKALDRAQSLTPAAAAGEAAAEGLNQRVSIAGTFSAAAAGRLGGGPLDQIAVSTAQSAKYLKQIAQSTPTIGFS